MPERNTPLLAFYGARQTIELDLAYDWRARVVVDRGGRLADGRPNRWIYVGVGTSPTSALADLELRLPWPPEPREARA